MASQRRVKEYLEKHKISPLFEDLMAKLIHSMPGDPLQYLVSVIERKIEKKKQTTGEGLRKSTGNLPAKQVGDSISAWTVGGSGGVSVAKDKVYEKPWNTNNASRSRTADSSTKPRSALKTDASPVRTRPGRPDASPVRKSSSGPRVAWNPDKKTQAGDFDDMWRMKQEEKSNVMPRQSQSPTRRARRTVSEDTDLAFTSHGYTGPRRHSSIDSLDEEFSTPKSPALLRHQNSVELASTRMGKRRSKRLSSNKQELQQLLEVEKFKSDSGYEEEPDIDNQEDGTEVYEDEVELRREGVNNPKSSGVRFGSAINSSGSKGPLVRVSICGRCARVMTAGSEPMRGAATYTESPTYDLQSSVQFTHNVDDEEFESVSQVSGPRRPVWIEEDKVSTPRKGASMLGSSGYPHKGLPMYSRPEDVPSHPSPDSEMTSSPQPPGGDMVDVTDESSSPPQVSWNDVSTSPDGDERLVESPDALSARTRTWAGPADSDITDAAWAPERVRRARANNQGNGHY